MTTTAVESRLRVMAAWLHDQVGRPFRWLILQSPARNWIQRTDPNAWSFLRLPLSFIIAVLLQQGFDLPAAGVFFVALLTDRLDGELARATQRCSPLGERIDTLVDGAMMAGILLGLADRLPVVTAGVLAINLGLGLVLLEALRLIGGFVLGSLSQTVRERSALEPNLSGKYKMAVVGLAVLLLLFKLSTLALVSFHLGLGLAMYSQARHLLDWGFARAQRPPS